MLKRIHDILTALCCLVVLLCVYNFCFLLRKTLVDTLDIGPVSAKFGLQNTFGPFQFFTGISKECINIKAAYTREDTIRFVAGGWHVGNWIELQAKARTARTEELFPPFATTVSTKASSHCSLLSLYAAIHTQPISQESIQRADVCLNAGTFWLKPWDWTHWASLLLSLPCSCKLQCLCKALLILVWLDTDLRGSQNRSDNASGSVIVS